MKKTLILALALLLAIFCFTACDSDDDTENRVEVKSYDELKSAIEKSTGNDVIVLGTNITLETGKWIEIGAGKNIVLDLGGKDIVSTTSDYQAVLIDGGGKLTIQGDGTISSKGKVLFAKDGELVVNGGNYVSTSNDMGIKVGDSPKDSDGKATKGTSGKLTFNNGTVSAKVDTSSPDGSYAVGAFSGSTVVINGGTFTAEDNAVIATNGYVSAKDSSGAYTDGWGKNSITINGGKFIGTIKESGEIACGAYICNTDALTLNGGEFDITEGIGILMRCGTLYANSCKITLNKGTRTSGKVGDSKIKVLTEMEIVADGKSGYFAGTPKIAANKTGYTVKNVDGGIWDGSST